MSDYIVDKPKDYIRPEVHRRASFAVERAEFYYKSMGYALKGGNVLSCRSTRKFLQARRIYIHYLNEFQTKQNLPLSK